VSQTQSPASLAFSGLNPQLKGDNDDKDDDEDSIPSERSVLLKRSTDGLSQTRESGDQRKKIFKWLYIDQYIEQANDPLTFKDKLKLLAVPFDTCILSTIGSQQNKYLVLAIHETFIRMDSERNKSMLKDIREAAFSVLVLCSAPVEAVELSAELGIPIDDCLLQTASMEEIFRSVQRLTLCRKPRELSPESYQSIIADLQKQLAYPNAPSTAPVVGNPNKTTLWSPSIDNGSNRFRLSTERAQAKLTARWKTLLTQAENEMKLVAPDRQNVFSSVFSGCRERVENPTVERDTSTAYSFECCNDPSDPVLIQLDTGKRRTKYVLDQFLPDISALKCLMMKKSYADIVELTAKSAYKADELRLKSLSNSFRVFQDVIELIKSGWATDSIDNYASEPASGERKDWILATPITSPVSGSFSLPVKEKEREKDSVLQPMSR